MKKYSQRFKKENAFYIDEKSGRVKFNKKCSDCLNNCKQSYRSIILNCNYIKKDKKSD